jgi:hypothetical protein
MKADDRKNRSGACTVQRPPVSETPSAVDVHLDLMVEGTLRLDKTVGADGAATCEHELEGVVAKRRDSLYRPGDRGGWVKVKNRGYWRFHDERQLAQSRRRTRLTI